MQTPDRKPIPDAEPVQPDPELALSQGRASGLQIAVVALACAFILAVMIYGLGRPATEDGSVTASAPPPAEQTTGAAPPAEAPAQAAPEAGPQNAQTGKPAAGGEAAAPPAPAEQPVPQQTKPGVVPDDSAR